LDSGARISELWGLQWPDIDLDAAKVSIKRQLIDAGTRHKKDGRGTRSELLYGPTKTGRARVIDLSVETVRLLREHRRTQAELKLKNRLVYTDTNAVFAREHEHLYGGHALGTPLPQNMLSDRTFKRLIAEAHVRPITFYGLRHTSATLLLSNGEPIQNVAKRLGHSKVSMTLDVYAHALPSQRTAADRIGALLHG
jgi:integrase